MLRKGKCVVHLAGLSTIIVFSSANYFKTGMPIQVDGMISIPYLKVQPIRAPTFGYRQEPVEKRAADAAALAIVVHRKKEQLRLAGNDSAECEPDRPVRLAGEGQPHAGKRKQACALRRGPGFAEAGIEAGVHHRHHRLEIGDTALFQSDPRASHGIGFASGGRP